MYTKHKKNMSYVQRYICIYVALLMIIMGVGNSSHRHGVLAQDEPPYLTLDVDKSGNSEFSTIQSAIDYVPSNNQNWVTINIMAGTYNEQVKIPRDKPMIHLKGEGQQITNVVWGEANISTGATLISLADNILVQNMSFTQNSYNYPPEANQNPIKPATAVLIHGDKTAFYGCGFFGLQDTFWDYEGRHYFKDCTIQGVTDFIMGSGQSIYENCAIEAITKALGGQVGYITAQSRSDPSDTGGFVFKDCTVIGNGPTYLGRPWRDYARVLFYRSFLSDIIVPQGWSEWNSTNPVKDVTFAEEGCHGPGSDTSNRVQWGEKPNPQMLQWLTTMSFIDNEGWISQQPLTYWLDPSASQIPSPMQSAIAVSFYLAISYYFFL